MQQGEKQRQEKPRARWSKPLEGVLKLNCDASYFVESNSGNWGFLIRESDGDVILTGRGKVDYLLSAFQAELIACLQGVQAALDLGIGRLIPETDALMIQQELFSAEPCARPEGNMADDLKALVHSNFLQFECVFKNRDCNRAAHALGYECVEGDELITSPTPSNVLVIVTANIAAAE